MSAEVPGVPWTLARLKVRLLRNRARRSSRGALQLALGLLVALVIGGSFGIGGFAVGVSTDAALSGSLAVILATVLAVGWALLPLLTFGADEALDPARLVLFPLRRRPLMLGLVLASLVGPAPLGVVVAVTMTAAGYAVGGGGLVAVPAAVLLVVFSVTAARTLSTALASGLSSRRGRDATMIAAALFALSFQGLRFIDVDAIDASSLEGARDVLRWFPPGMLAQAIDDARAGRLLLALVELVVPAATIPVLLWLWSKALDRAMTVMGSSSGPARAESTAALPLMLRRLPLPAASPWAAVAAKELRYVWREPRRKVQLVNAVIIGAAVPLWLAASSSDDLGQRSVLLATLGAYLVVLGSSNQYGFDGAAHWIDLVAGDTVRTTMIGKNVAALAQMLPIVLVIGVAVAAISGGWAYLPVAVLLALAGLGAGLGTANVVSVRYPIRLPDSRSPFASSGGGQGCSRSAILMICLLVQNVLLLPIVGAGAVGAAVGYGWLVASIPLVLAYGALLWWAGTRAATDHARANGPELLAAVDQRRET